MWLYSGHVRQVVGSQLAGLKWMMEARLGGWDILRVVDVCCFIFGVVRPGMYWLCSVFQCGAVSGKPAVFYSQMWVIT
jgi:hypothetical protein